MSVMGRIYSVSMIPGKYCNEDRRRSMGHKNGRILWWTGSSYLIRDWRGWGSFSATSVCIIAINYDFNCEWFSLNSSRAAVVAEYYWLWRSFNWSNLSMGSKLICLSFPRCFLILGWSHAWSWVIDGRYYQSQKIMEGWGGYDPPG